MCVCERESVYVCVYVCCRRGGIQGAMNNVFRHFPTARVSPRWPCGSYPVREDIAIWLLDSDRSDSKACHGAFCVVLFLSYLDIGKFPTDSGQIWVKWISSNDTFGNESHFYNQIIALDLNLNHCTTTKSYYLGLGASTNLANNLVSKGKKEPSRLGWELRSQMIFSPTSLNVWLTEREFYHAPTKFLHKTLFSEAIDSNP